MSIREKLAIYFIAGSQDIYTVDNNLPSLLERALAAGISCFQLREKGARALQDSNDIKKLAKSCQTLCKHYDVPFFINDNIELALEIKADGIHVGQGDEEISKVIARCAPRLTIGLTINNLQQAIIGNLTGVDYFGVGPIYRTFSKLDAKDVVGTQLISDIRKQHIDKPIVAIGGINVDNAAKVRAAGADGIAVISAITAATHNNIALEEIIARLQGIDY